MEHLHASSPVPPEGCIETQVVGNVLLIGINRPAKRNGWTPRMFRELGEAYTRLDDEPELRVGVLHAFGDHFTAGLDMPKFFGPNATAKPRPEGNVDPFGMTKRCRKPIFAAVQGICFTVGIELMLAADIVIATSDCRFGQIEVKRGIMANHGATIRIVERAGWGNAMRYLLTGDEFSGAEAYRMGFVQELVEPGQALNKAVEIAQRVAAGAPLGVQASLRSSRLARNGGDVAALARLYPELKPIMQSEDAQEAVRAFMEKRQAQFKGR